MDHLAERFRATRWTTVLRAGAPDAPGFEQALAALCEDYRRPLFQFARFWLNSSDDAEDLLQGFFCHLIQKNLAGAVAPGQGRFRSFLIAAFKNFVRDHWRREQRRKLVSIDALADAESGEPAGNSDEVGCLTPELEHRLDRLWAESIRARVCRQLESEYAARGKGAILSALAPLLDGHDLGGSYAEVAARLGIAEGQLKVEVHRLRERFRARFREEVRETVLDEAALEDEARYLLRLACSD